MRLARGALLLAVLAGLSGCGDQVRVSVPELSAEERERCDALLAALPQTLLGGERRETTPAGAPGAAWGDPAVVLLCGAEEPAEYDEFSACTEVDRVGWFVPDQQLRDPQADVTLTAMSHSPRVQLQIPAERRDQGADAAMTGLAPLVHEHLEQTSPCH